YPAIWRPFAVRSWPSLETAGDRPRRAGDGPRPVRAGSAWPLVPDRSCLHRPPGSSAVTSRVHSAGTLPTEGCCWSGDAAVAQVEKVSGPAQGAGSAVGVRRRVLLILRPQGGQPFLIMLHPITSAAARAPDMLGAMTTAPVPRDLAELWEARCARLQGPAAGTSTPRPLSCRPAAHSNSTSPPFSTVLPDADRSATARSGSVHYFCRTGRGTRYCCSQASRSALMTSACVAGMPCG